MPDSTSCPRKRASRLTCTRRVHLRAAYSTRCRGDDAIPQSRESMRDATSSKTSARSTQISRAAANSSKPCALRVSGWSSKSACRGSRWLERRKAKCAAPINRGCPAGWLSAPPHRADVSCSASSSRLRLPCGPPSRECPQLGVHAKCRLRRSRTPALPARGRDRRRANRRRSLRSCRT